MVVLEDMFLGKDVEIKILDRDQQGKITPNNFTTVTGKCNFIGPNRFLNIPLQVTINRTPYEVKHVNDIKCITR